MRFAAIAVIVMQAVYASPVTNGYVKQMQSTLPHLQFSSIPYRLPAAGVGSPLNFQQWADVSSSFNDDGYSRVLQEHTISSSGADWLRLYFDAEETVLPLGSRLILRSNFDGAEQVFDNANSLAEWSHSSAYFNGDSVTIRLLTVVNSGKELHAQNLGARFQLKSFDAGRPQPAAESLCTSVDRRELSYYRRAGRIMPVGCTGWLIDDQQGCLLSAGHCKPGAFTKNYVIQFQVPMSHPNGTVRHPDPSDQYPIDHRSIQHHQNIQPGNDWMYFGAFPNSNTRLTARSAQQDYYVLAKNLSSAIPARDTTLEVIGYGTTYYPLRAKSQVQQFHRGPFMLADRFPDGVRWSLEYRVDTTGGNSGSAVTNVETGEAIAVHAYAGCGYRDDQAGNSGTFLGQLDLQAALKHPKGVCKPADY